MGRVFESRFPVAGIDQSRAFWDQSARPLPQGQWDVTGELKVVPGSGPQPEQADVYGRTSYLGVNVQGFEATTDRRRGGTRGGLAKFVSNAVMDAVGWIVQDLNKLVTVGGGSMQPSQMGRVVWLVSVSQGNVAYFRAGDSAWTAASNATGNSPPLIFTGVVFSAANGQKLWYADGTNWCYFDPSDTTVHTWVANAGTLPQDSNNNTPRLIANWRGRIVLSGLFLQPQAVFMSAVDDPLDWDFARPNYSPTQAFATTLGPQNSPGAPVTALMPFNDDIMLVGTDHELWQISGDPQAGGQISLLTNAIGVAWGQAWCQDPYGTIYFVSNKMGVYSVLPNQLPQRISQAVEQLFQAVNTGTNAIRLVWDDKFQAVRIFITPLLTPAAATHYVWEARTGAWWQVAFANNNHNPICVCDFDGNTNEDRSVLIGSWDGYVRYFDATAVDDDGYPINSEVWIGPVLSKNFDEMRIDEAVVDLGDTSGAVRYDIHPGVTAEAAVSSTSVANGTFTAGRNNAEPIRYSAHGIYVKLSSTVAWAFERMRLAITDKGPVTGRRK